MLSSQSLHLCDSLALVDNEFLVPHRCECLKLTTILLLNLHFLPGMLVDEGYFEARFSLLSNCDDPLQLHLSSGKVALSLIEYPLRI